MSVEISVAANDLSEMLYINTAHVVLYLQLLCHYNVDFCMVNTLHGGYYTKVFTRHSPSTDRRK